MQLREYLKIIRKRWWLALIVALAAAAVAFVYSISQPRIYETQVTVQGRPAKPDEGLNNAIKTELRRLPSTLASSNLAAQIDQKGRFDLGAGAILDKIKAQARPDEAIVKITVSDTDPKRAARIADTAADIIRDSYQEAYATIPDDSKIFFEKTARAPVPDRPSTPRTNLNTAAAAGLGLLLGLLLIFVVNFFDNTLRTEEDVEQFTGLKVLGAVPGWQATATRRADLSGLPAAPPSQHGQAADGQAEPNSQPKPSQVNKEP